MEESENLSLHDQTAVQLLSCLVGGEKAEYTDGSGRLWMADCLEVSGLLIITITIQGELFARIVENATGADSHTFYYKKREV